MGTKITIKTRVITKWQTLWPISSQLPSSFIKKKKLIAIKSVISNTTKNKARVGIFNIEWIDRKLIVTIRNGIKALMEIMTPCTGLLYTVWKQYVLVTSNELTLAILPVPKNERNMKYKKMNEIRTWSIVIYFSTSPVCFPASVVE